MRVSLTLINLIQYEIIVLEREYRESGSERHRAALRRSLTDLRTDLSNLKLFTT